MHFILLSLLPIHITVVTLSSLKPSSRAAQLLLFHPQRCPHPASHSESCSITPHLLIALHAYFIIQGYAPNFVILSFPEFQ
ncbi:hypothetical protein ACQKWADRAFT_281599 [Trichoderma austrokoningii]